MNAFGAAIEKIMNTLKRLSIFSFPPALGYFVMRRDLDALFFAIFVAIVFAALSVSAAIFFRHSLARYFFMVSKSFGGGSGVLRSFIRPDALLVDDRERLSDRGENVPGLVASLRQHLPLLLMATWVYFIFGASIFLINILAIFFVDAAPVILQGLGFFNGLGTLVLAFLIDPKISRFLDNRESLDEITLVILTSQFSSIAIVSPIVFGSLYAVSHY
ncbi:hypothetical protein DDE23_10355 [Pararhodobacter aggregans]|uniref:Uncharacterized protein n=2 Tax=Pararhodobacter aggregans TaxID=404875 RepID=A0A2T7USV6_9RHOB|nr:hypothetical protein DDE23_10355 [Pararhodobacter aggregans]